MADAYLKNQTYCLCWCDCWHSICANYATNRELARQLVELDILSCILWVCSAGWLVAWRHTATADLAAGSRMYLSVSNQLDVPEGASIVCNNNNLLSVMSAL